MKFDQQKPGIQYRRHAIVAVLFPLLMMAAVPCLWGADGSRREVVKAGDRAEVHVICKETSGDIILTSYQAVAEDPSKKKSDIYESLQKFEPLRIIAGQGEKYSGTDPLKEFNTELAARLSEAIVGLGVGESVSVTFKAPVPDGLKKEDRYITLSRRRNLPKKMTRPMNQFSMGFGKEPVLGQVIPTPIGVSARVTAVQDQNVELELVGKTGDRIETPWGTGILKDQGDTLQLDLDTRVGRLVRTGPYVGRIMSVEDTQYTMDFGFPFGNEMVICDISVVSILEESNEK